jgi:phosphohistidine phosphatase
MRELLLLRHAKSSWADHGVRDHDRPLNPRGERDAPRIGAFLREVGRLPDLVLASSALRARSTAERVAAAAGLDPELVSVQEDLYLAAPGTLVDVVRRRAGAAQRVLVVAHNPGLEDLVEALAGRHERFPTAALAAFELNIDAWPDLALMSPARLDGLWRPKELDD